MSLFFDWIYLIVHQIIQELGYPGIALLMFVENLFPPMPSEMVMPFSGFIAAKGELELTLLGVLIVGTVGSVTGALAIYYIGHLLGEERLRAWTCKYGKYLLISGQDFDKALVTFDRYGKLAVFFGRLIPGVRSLISIPAGLRGMKLPAFIGLTLAGATIWNTFMVGAGYVLGQNWRVVLEFLDFMND